MVSIIVYFDTINAPSNEQIVELSREITDSVQDFITSLTGTPLDRIPIMWQPSRYSTEPGMLLQVEYLEEMGPPGTAAQVSRTLREALLGVLARNSRLLPKYVAVKVKPIFDGSYGELP